MIKNIIKLNPLINRILNKNVYRSVNNYMKTYQSHQITRHHGIFRVDQHSHYDHDSTQVQLFIQKERELYKQESSKWKSYTEEYFKIVSSRKDNRIATIPEPYDTYEYFTKIAWKNGRQYTVVHRKPLNSSQASQVVLDIMQYPQISRYSKTAELIQTAFSPSHRYVAFGVDLKNNEKSYFYIADTQHPKQQLVKIKQNEDSSSIRIEEIKDLVFISENEVFYSKTDNYRPCKIFYHHIEKGEISQILHQTDSQYHLHLKLSKDKKFLIISGQTRTKSKIWIMDLQQKKRQITKVCEQAGKVFIDHVENHFIYWVENDASSIKIIEDSEFRTKNKAKEGFNFKKLNQKVLHTCLQQEIIEQIDLIKDHIVLYIQKINAPVLKIINYHHDKQSPQNYKVNVFDAKLPYQFGTIMPQTNQNYHSDKILFHLSTPFVYKEVYEYSVKFRNFKVLEKFEHTGPKISIDKYQVKNINVPSSTMDYIPMTLISPKKKSVGKLLINTYGFYGISTKITYDNVNIAALQKGWTIAYAHIRGGGQKGKKWHKQSLRENRDRTWKDIEECVGYLIKQEYTHPSLLFIHTNSAGAIAAWHTINRKPHLYKGVIMRYPFLDVLTSLMDSSQPLSNTDYEQFGNPIENKLAYHQIQAISPYQNISTKQYPAIHIVAGQNDYRTPVHQIAKFVDRFRERSLKNDRFLDLGVKGVTVDISSSASHLGESSIKDENYKGCEMFGYMDYVIKKISKDCSVKQD